MKTKSTFASMTLALVLVTLISGLSLGYIYKLTKGPIEQARIEKQLRAIRAVTDTFDNDPFDESYLYPFAKGDSIRIFPAEVSGKPTGVAIESFSDQGYSGRISVLVGFNAQGNIQNIEVLDHKETPGLGSKMTERKFKSQFTTGSKSGSGFEVARDGGEVQAISGATITSRAYCEAVNRAVEIFKDLTDEANQSAD